MSARLTRRDLLASSVAGVVAAGAAGAAVASPASEGRDSMHAEPPSATPRKAMMWGMLPGSHSREDRMKLARDVGFEGIESPPISDPAEAEAMRKAADAAGIRIHSVIFGGWGAPMSSADPEVVARGSEQLLAALTGASIMGADGLLLVPGIVNAKSPYRDTYKRSMASIRKLIPAAERAKVAILIENVWNNFLLSPMEFARYVDEFRSKWVQAYFDVGNVVAFAWPEDWVRTLGPRIRKVHLKDFRGGPGLGSKGDFVNLREGSVNWPEVRRALAEVGFSGYMTPELGGGDAAYLRDISDRIDKILAGQ